MRSMLRLLLLLIVPLLPASALADGLSHARAAAAAEQAGNRDEAIRLYTLAIQSGDLAGTQLAHVYFRRGSLRGYLGENGPAIEDFSNAIRHDPSHGSAFSLRGYLRGIAGDYGAAESDHRSALELAPATQGRSTYLAWALQHYADLRRRQRRFDEALELLGKALADSDFADAYFRRAWVRLDMGQIEAARGDFEHFARTALRDQRSIDVYWPDEREAIRRLEQLTKQR